MANADFSREQNQTPGGFDSGSYREAKRPDTEAVRLTPLQQKWSDEHWLLQYDLMFGKGYALSRMGLEELSEGAD